MEKEHLLGKGCLSLWKGLQYNPDGHSQQVDADVGSKALSTQPAGASHFSGRSLAGMKDVRVGCCTKHSQDLDTKDIIAQCFEHHICKMLYWQQNCCQGHFV